MATSISSRVILKGRKAVQFTGVIFEPHGSTKKGQTCSEVLLCGINPICFVSIPVSC